MIESLLRWFAIAIAVLAFVDPQVTLNGRARPRISVMTSGGGEASTALRRTLRHDLAGDFDTVDGLDPSAQALVVVGNRYPDTLIDERANVSTVTIGPSAERRVAVSRVVAPRSVPPATIVRLGVDVTASMSRGTTSELSVRAAGAEVAHRSHTWNADVETWHFDVDVVPVGVGPHLFDVGTDGSNLPVVIDVAPPLKVLVVESRPSWTTAFVRRALEGDPRFEVSSIAAASPQTLVKSGASPQIPDDVRTFDAILIGGLDRLSPANLTTFERFTRDRGGSLMLLPDAPIPASVAQRLIAGIALHETLLERPAALDTSSGPRLEASELLEVPDAPPVIEVIARAPSSRNPVVWSIANGDGRVVVSGAMDAWRYRNSGEDAFGRFWRSVVSGAALAARPAVDVSVVPDHAAAGDRVHVVARVRSLERQRFGNQLSISARVGAAALRLWPDAALGVFSGSFIVDTRPNATTQRVTATLGDGTSGSARLTIAPQPEPANGPPLSWLSRTRGGIDVAPSELAALRDHLRRTIAAESIRIPRHLMRSGWWFFPFASCLAAEWWLRRRRGAR